MSNMCLLLQSGCPFHLQIDDGLLTIDYLVELVHLYVANYDIYCDTDDTLGLNVCSFL